MTRDSMLSLDSLEAHATEEMAKQYAQLDQDWWNGRNAFSFRFDNLRLMASRLLKAQPAQQHAVRSAIADGLRPIKQLPFMPGFPGAYKPVRSVILPTLATLRWIRSASMRGWYTRK